MMKDEGTADAIAKFGRKYLWWQPAEGHTHPESRIIAQVMNFGTYEDILLLEHTVGHARLIDAMLHAEPGWFDDRSWEFWRGRLSCATGVTIPGQAPRRVFDAATP